MQQTGSKLTVEQKRKAVDFYHNNRLPYEQASKQIGCTASSLKRWCREIRQGKILCSHGGARPHHHGFTQEEVEKLVSLKGLGLTMLAIAEHLRRNKDTVYKIQNEAIKQGLLEKGRKHGHRT